jgi:alkylation response protein AidB-like acyl-CoA dehydrogenase
VDFDFSEEQVMLRDVTREVLTAQCPPARVRVVMDEADGYDAGLWAQLAETGLLGATIPEEFGGQGLGMVEQALMLDEMGRAAYPGPYFATFVLAAPSIASGSNRPLMQRYLPAFASGEARGTLAMLEDNLSWQPDGVKLRARQQVGQFTLNGSKRFVPFAHVADVIVVAARTSETSDPARGITLFAVPSDTPGVSIEPVVAFDLTNRASTVTFDDVRVGSDAILGRQDDGWSILEGVLQRAAVGSAAEMLGASRKSLDIAVEYAKVREQFGQPIGSFQAVKHKLAEMLMDAENSHAATYYAAWAVAAEAPDAGLAASVAKSFVSEASRHICGDAIQAHGGIGFTWEYDLHLYFKRAKFMETMYGSADAHRELALRSLLQPAEQLALA